MNREVHVRFSEGVGVRFPCATHLNRGCPSTVTGIRGWSETTALKLKPVFGAAGEQITAQPTQHVWLEDD